MRLVSQKDISIQTKTKLFKLGTNSFVTVDHIKSTKKNTIKYNQLDQQLQDCIGRDQHFITHTQKTL